MQWYSWRGKIIEQAVLCKGELLAELDHDDYLTPNATQLLYDAMNAYPDAGFYYTDCVEVDEDWNSLRYGRRVLQWVMVHTGMKKV